MVLLEKCIETCEKASNFKALRHLGATPKPWVAGSSPPAPAKKIKSTFFVGFFFLLGYNLRRTRRGAVVNDSPVDCQSRGRPKSRSKAAIKNSALRRSDETDPYPQKSKGMAKTSLFVLVGFNQTGVEGARDAGDCLASRKFASQTL